MGAPRQRVLAASALLVLAPLILAGCRTEVSTTVDVTSATQASLSVAVVLHDEAADAVLSEPSLDEQLAQTLHKRTGGTVERHADPKAHLVSYRAELPYDRLASASKVVGVSGVDLSSRGDDVVVTTTMVHPDDLVSAIESGQAGSKDADAVTATIEETTDVQLVVDLPGHVTSATTTVGGAVVTRDGSRATISTPLSHAAAGTVVVTGGAHAPLLTPVRGAVALVVLVVLALVVLRARRRR